MFRIGMMCLVLVWLAGCAAPVSLKEDPPVPSLSTDRPVAPSMSEQPDLGKVQVLPIDRQVRDAPTWEDTAPLRELATHDHPGVTTHERLRGVFSAQGWQLCGQKQSKVVHVADDARAALESFLAQRPVFFLDGWGRDNGKDIELDNIERMVVEGSGCREPLAHFVWIARGQEPFWAFAITHAGMQWRRPGEAPQTYAYTVAQNDGEHIRYVGENYHLSLRRQACTDAAQTEAHYTWTAELNIEGQQWRGCAWRGMQTE